MTFADLLSRLFASPETLGLLLAACTALSMALGAVGTAIEAVGAAMHWPLVERFGQRVESLFTDLPKLWRGSRAPLRALQSKDSAAAVSDNDEPYDNRASGR